MRYLHSGTSLWYGTSDAPAPEGDTPANAQGRAAGLSITFAVEPVRARYKVQARYRVNGGPDSKLMASLARTDVRLNTQYYVARLPDFRVGDQVEYIGVVTWPGGQVPAANVAATFPSSFNIERR